MSKMTQCKSCAKEIATSAKSCPGCGAKNKKPIYKRVWFWVIAIIIVIGATGGSGTDDSKEVNRTIGMANKYFNGIIVNKNFNEDIDVEFKEYILDLKNKVEDNIPTEYKSALRKAKLYADTMNMSKAGLYDQLTSEYGEKFTVEAAQYAIDNITVDWKENALKKAKLYQETMSMSPAAIYDQLISEYGEKFTAEEAQYAIDNLN